MVQAVCYFKNDYDVFGLFCGNGRIAWHKWDVSDFPDTDDEGEGLKALNGLAARDNFDIASLPRIEDATPSMQVAYKTITECEDNDEQFVEVEDAPDNDFVRVWGIHKQTFCEEILSDMEKYHLEDIVENVPSKDVYENGKCTEQEYLFYFNDGLLTAFSEKEV